MPPEKEAPAKRINSGAMGIRAKVTKKVSEGAVFVPMHYREAAAKVITNDARDPKVKIPEFKACAVRVAAVS